MCPEWVSARKTLRNASHGGGRLLRLIGQSSRVALAQPTGTECGQILGFCGKIRSFRVLRQAHGGGEPRACFTAAPVQSQLIVG